MGFLESFPRVGACCCCVQLRTGAIIIGVVELIQSILFIGGGSASREAQRGIAAVGINSVIGIILAIVLLIGVLKDKPTLVLVWIWSTLVFLIILLISAIIMFFSVPAEAVALLIILALNFYYWICVNSYHQEGGSVITTSFPQRA